MIDARIPLMSQGIDSMKMLADGSQIAQYIQQQRTDGELNRLYQASQGNLTKMLELGQQSKLSRFVMPHLQAQQTAQNKALQDQQQAAADIAKTSSEAYKNTQQGAGYGIDNSSKQMTGINSAVLQGTQTGDRSQILTGLGGLLRTGMINQDTYQYYSQALNNMTPEQTKQWSRGIAFGGAKDPAALLYPDANTVSNNAQSDVNNQRTTNASIYSSDVSAETVNKNRDQEQQQFDNKLEYQRQQDEVKNKQGEFKEFGGKVYIVYKDGTYRSAVDANGQQMLGKENSTTLTKVAETQSSNDEIIQTIQKLEQAKQLSSQGIYDGAFSDFRANVIGNIGGTEASRRTQYYNNIVMSNALASLKTIFGGNPTEGERAILLKVQASSAYPAPVRNKILSDAISLSKARLQSNNKQIQILKGEQISTPIGPNNVDSFQYIP